MSHSLRIQNIFFFLHAVWYEDRAFQLLKFSILQEVKKGFLQNGLLRAQKIYFNVFGETNVVLFTCY